MAERFQRSVVGAVSLMVVGAVPVVGLVRRWTQKVSPVAARNSSTLVCAAPTVRGVALSQSAPTAQISEPILVGVMVRVGAPVLAWPLPTAALLLALAPRNAATATLPR